MKTTAIAALALLALGASWTGCAAQVEKDPGPGTGGEGSGTSAPALPSPVASESVSRCITCCTQCSKIICQSRCEGAYVNCVYASPTDPTLCQESLWACDQSCNTCCNP
jgi:hypothetical protein